MSENIKTAWFLNAVVSNKIDISHSFRKAASIQYFLQKRSRDENKARISTLCRKSSQIKDSTFHETKYRY